MSGGGDAYSVWHSPGGETASNQCGVANQEVTSRPSWFDCRNLTDSWGENSPFYREFGPYYACAGPQRCGHPADVVPGIATVDGRCPRCRPWILGWWAHCISLLDRYRSPTKCKKVRSCDIYIPIFRWFKFTLKPPYTITHGNLLMAIWDTFHWTSFVKFGHKTA